MLQNEGKDQSLENAIINCENYIKESFTENVFLGQSIVLLVQKVKRDLDNEKTIASDKPFTWNDLMLAVSYLPAKFRNEQVHISIDDETVFKKVKSIESIHEDIYMKNDNDVEDSGTLQELKEFHGESFDEAEYSICTSKGMPFLWDGN